VSLVLTGACRPAVVSKTKLEAAFAPTFANLIQTEEAMLGSPNVDARAFRASASCDRTGPGPSASVGGGHWVCTVSWSIPGRGALRDTYDVTVTPDACFTATAEGESAHVGGPTIKTPAGTSVPNLLYAFDGCFDPT
jgi:ABC-2 type transport system permease protein